MSNDPKTEEAVFCEECVSVEVSVTGAVCHHPKHTVTYYLFRQGTPGKCAVLNQFNNCPRFEPKKAKKDGAK